MHLFYDKSGTTKIGSFTYKQTILNLLKICGIPAITGPYRTPFSYKSQSGTAVSLISLGKAK